MYIIFLGLASLKGQIVTFPCIEGGQIIVYLACDEDGYCIVGQFTSKFAFGHTCEPCSFQTFLSFNMRNTYLAKTTAAKGLYN